MPFDMTRQRSFGARKVIGGVRTIVRTGRGEVNRGDHRPDRLAQRAGHLHRVERALDLVAHRLPEIGFKQQPVIGGEKLPLAAGWRGRTSGAKPPSR